MSNSALSGFKSRAEGAEGACKMILDPIKHVTASLLNVFKDIPWKACPIWDKNNNAFVNVGN